MTTEDFRESIDAPNIDLALPLSTLHATLIDILATTPLKGNGFSVLQEKIAGLGEVTCVNEDLIERTDDSISKRMQSSAENRRADHLKMYGQHLKVMQTAEDGSLQWADAGNDPNREHFPAVIRSADVVQTTRRNWLSDISSYYEQGTDVVDAAVHEVTGRVIDAAIRLQEAAGSIHPSDRGLLKRGVRWLLSSGDGYKKQQQLAERNQMVRELEANKQASRLARQIEHIATSFPGLVAEEIINIIGDELRADVSTATDVTITSLIYEKFGELHTKKPKRAHVPKVAQIAIESGAASHVTEPIHSAVKEVVLEEGEFRFSSGVIKKDIGLADYSFPWMGDASMPFRLTRYSGSADVYVVQAL